MSDGAGECDILFFELAGQRFGADPCQVVRVDRWREELPTVWLIPAAHPSRALVALGPTGEVQVPVERVLGVQRVPLDVLRPAPPFLADIPTDRAEELLGVVLLGERPLLVFDLQVMALRALAEAA